MNLKKYSDNRIYLIILSLLAFSFSIVSLTSAPSTYVISGDSVYAENAGKGIILQKPHTLDDLSNFPIINFTSEYPQARNFDVLIGFTGNSAKVVSANLWENYPHNLANQNCTVSWSNTSSQNGTWDNHTSNACYPYTYSSTYFDWKPLTLNYLEYAGKNYFSISNISVDPQETKTIQPRIEISPKLGENSGKYEILVKLSDSTLFQALGTGDNVLLDPWWNSTFQKCRNINVTDTTGKNWTNAVSAA